jgi:hypothetical protein
MKKHTTDDTAKTPENYTRPHDLRCEPCEIPALCRNNYFTGKLLTEHDFKAEQRYFFDKLRLHHLALHGWGVVCGLKVKPHPHCPHLRIIVEPGLAIDGCGREIRLLEEVQITLPAPLKPSAEDNEPCPPDPTDKPPSDKETPGQAKDKHAGPHQHGGGQEDTGPHQHGGGYTQEDEPHQEIHPCPPGPEPAPPETLYICLRYAECEKGLMPAPFDECSCGGKNGKKPTRICQGYEIEVLTEDPGIFKKVKEHRDHWEHCGSGDCRDIYDEMLKPCPQFGAECVPLAIITDFIRGEPVTKKMIDNSYRQLLPSTSLLNRLIHCILDKIPTRELTRITDISWNHRGEYGCHDFMKQFIGDENNTRGFEITFNGKINTDGLSRRTFQAIAVRYPEKGGPGHYEVPPMKVRWEDDKDGYTHIFLEIDPKYAHQRLHRVRFDLFILLRCNLIIDHCGYPVDGDLLAEFADNGKYQARFPTGNGTPGGLFESWIRVLA